MKDYQNSIEKLQELKEFMSENEYRKSYTVITTNYVIDYYQKSEMDGAKNSLRPDNLSNPFQRVHDINEPTTGFWSEYNKAAFVNFSPLNKPNDSKSSFSIL